MPVIAGLETNGSREFKSILFKCANPGLFVFFGLFTHKFDRKNAGFSGIRTRIVGVEGNHADHLTTTTTALKSVL